MLIPREIADRYSKPPIGSVVRTAGDEHARLTFTDEGRAFCTLALKEGDVISKDKFTDPYWLINSRNERGLKIFLSEGDSRKLRENPREFVRAVKVIAYSKSGRCVFGVVI